MYSPANIPSREHKKSITCLAVSLSPMVFSASTSVDHVNGLLSNSIHLVRIFSSISSSLNEPSLLSCSR